MQGNVCRCGTHPRIVTAITKASQKMLGGCQMSKENKFENAIEPDRYELFEKPTYLFEFDRRGFLKYSAAESLLSRCLILSFRRSGHKAARASQEVDAVEAGKARRER